MAKKTLPSSRKESAGSTSWTTAFAAVAAFFGALNYVYPSSLIIDWWLRSSLTAQSMTKAMNMAVFDVRNTGQPTANEIEIVIYADGISNVTVSPMAGATITLDGSNEHRIVYPKLASGEAFRIGLTYKDVDPRRQTLVADNGYILQPYVGLFRSREGAGQILPAIDGLE
jgi:hypothetical protein